MLNHWRYIYLEKKDKDVTLTFIYSTNVEICVSNSSNGDIFLYGDQDETHCNDRIHIQGKDALQDRSYCPWYNQIQHDKNRYPPDIAQARCRCKESIALGGKSECREVRYFMMVLRNTGSYGSDGLFIYKPCLQFVSVGCTPTPFKNNK